MNILIVLSCAWILYGIVGLFGYQIAVKEEYKGHFWTRNYIRKQGFSWILLGCPYLVFFIVFQNTRLDFIYTVLILIVISLPSILFTFTTDKKYRELLKTQQDYENQM